MPKPFTKVEIQEQTWPEGREFIPEKYSPDEEVYLPLSPQHLQEIEIRRKTHKY